MHELSPSSRRHQQKENPFKQFMITLWHWLKTPSMTTETRYIEDTQDMIFTLKRGKDKIYYAVEEITEQK